MKESRGEGSGSSVASLTAKTKINIRGGPSTEYEVLGLLELGQKAEVIGVSSDRQWWAIRIPGRESVQGWVAASLVETENVENVPVLP